jgi:hypothetical protein
MALCVGLTKLDPAAYDGWEGDCPGCDLDAYRMAKKCHSVGFDGVSVLLNEAATAENIRDNFLHASARLSSGDLLLLFSSGHGGQDYDVNGDEEDCCDETLCWWDGQVNDDTIGSFLFGLPTGLRVVYITDTCNSGTNFRNLSHRHKKLESPEGILFLHIGGCEDGRSSYGDERGGYLTLKLMDALSDARKPLSYQEWFDRTLLRMDAEVQKPAIYTLGESFLDQQALA